MTTYAKRTFQQIVDQVRLLLNDTNPNRMAASYPAILATIQVEYPIFALEMGASNSSDLVWSVALNPGDYTGTLSTPLTTELVANANAYCDRRDSPMKEERYDRLKRRIDYELRVIGQVIRGFPERYSILPREAGTQRYEIIVYPAAVLATTIYVVGTGLDLSFSQALATMPDATLNEDPFVVSAFIQRIAERVAHMIPLDRRAEIGLDQARMAALTADAQRAIKLAKAHRQSFLLADHVEVRGF